MTHNLSQNIAEIVLF